MQQMNNILLAPNVTNTAASSKVSRQDTQSEDFSAAMAFVGSTSEISTISKASSVSLSASIPTTPPIEFAQRESNTADTDLEDEADIQLIFAQIEMAQGMKNVASQGESLPLNAQLTAVTDPALPQSQVSEASAPFVDEQVKPNSAAISEGPAAISEGITSVKQTDAIVIQGLSVTAEADTAFKQTENDLLPMVGQSMLAASSQGGQDSQWQLQANNLSTQNTASSMASAAESRVATNMANGATNMANGVTHAMGVDGIAEYSAKTVTSNDMSMLVGASGVANPIEDSPNEADIAAGLMLKEAKMAVSLDTRQENTVALFDTDREAPAAEFKPIEFKALTPSQALASQQLQRQEIPQLQLSLRLVGESQNPMQEMIQRFSPLMGQQLVTMVSQGLQQAEIRLDPPELGHMLVKIQVQGDQTQVQFHVTQSQTRDLVEQAIPRLRELLQEQGMQLADSHVSQGDQGQRKEDGSPQAEASRGGNVDNFSAEEQDFGINQATSSNSAIDYYA